jgi:hypothetical protein
MIEGVATESRKECRAAVIDITKAQASGRVQARFAAIVASSDAIISKDLDG